MLSTRYEKGTETSSRLMDTSYDFAEDNSVISPPYATKLDGSLIDLTVEDGTSLVDDTSLADGTSLHVTADGTALTDGTSLSDGMAFADGTLADGTTTVDSMSLMDGSTLLQEESSVVNVTMDFECSDIVGEVVEEQVIDNPLTPVTDYSGATKSQPGSGRVTPASQSDQSLTFSSSEKGTPSHKLRVSDIASRQMDYDSMSSSSGSVKNMQLPQRTGISWRKGENLEAMDYLNAWFPAKIRSINEEDMQVLIHFDGWNQRYDEWIDMTSERIRPLVRHSDRKERNKRSKSSGRRDSFTSPTSLSSKRQPKEHKIGDAVYAKWTDCKMYPAKITSIMPTGSYEVIFYDGFKKLVQPINIRPMPNELKQKSFEINPVPELVLKKVKMKLDTTETTAALESESPEDKPRSRSTEKMKAEVMRESSTEKEKKQPKTKKRKLVIPGLFNEAAIVGLMGDGMVPDIQIKMEPVSTQTEYSDSKLEVAQSIMQEPRTSQIPDTISKVSQPQIPLIGPLPPKAFVVEPDHNHFKCDYERCNKSFRKEHLLDYHVKYYHINGGGPPPPAKRRRKTTSTCSTESDHVTNSRKSAGKKNRNLSAESVVYLQEVKQEYPDTPLAYAKLPYLAETGEISTQTSPSKQTDVYPVEDLVLSFKQEPKQDSMEESSVTDAEDYLKPDELVNCICDFQEENGLMIQCEVCMCWQHAACFGITERTLPKTYVCFVCENPPGVRESSRYIHEQDWFKTGEIASFSFLPVALMSEDKCSTVKSTHTLVAEIHQLNTVLHSLRLQLNILRTKDESKLKQWRVDWDVIEMETMETCPNSDENSTEFGHGVEEKNIMEESLENTKTKSENEKKEIEIKMELDLVKHDNKHTGVSTNVNELIEGDDKPILKESLKTDSKTTEELDQVVDADKETVATSEGPVVKSVSPVGEEPAVKSVSPVGEEPAVKTVSPVGEEPAMKSVSPVGEEPAVKSVSPVGEEPAVKSVSPVGEEPAMKTVSPLGEGPAMKTVSPLGEGPAVKIESEASDVNIEFPKEIEIKQEPAEKPGTFEPEEGNNSDSTESVVEDPIEVCEKNLLSHILRIQGEVSDKFDKIEEQIEMLEAMEAMQSRRELPIQQNVLNDMPQLKRSLRNMQNDLCKVKKMSVFH